jgi:hypothetical protein
VVSAVRKKENYCRRNACATTSHSYLPAAMSSCLPGRLIPRSWYTHVDKCVGPLKVPRLYARRLQLDRRMHTRDLPRAHPRAT